MYCRMCGNKLRDMDHYCQFCGMPTEFKDTPSERAESAEMKEEVVFNPPYDNKTQFAEDEPALEFSEPESESEQEATEPGAGKSSEFIWNVHEFPDPESKKTDAVKFNWNMEDFGRPEEKEVAATVFEEELFQEIRDESSRIREQNIDRFFTFSRKNEEFQKLLDREYEKVRKRSVLGIEAPEEPKVPEEPKAPEVPIESIHIEEEVSEDVPHEEPSHVMETPLNEEIPLETETPLNEGIPLNAETPMNEEIPFDTEIAPNEEVPLEPESILTESVADSPAKPSAASKAEHISEMAKARAEFFGEDLIRDNESIKKTLTTEGAEEDEIPHLTEKTAEEGAAEQGKADRSAEVSDMEASKEKKAEEEYPEAEITDKAPGEEASKAGASGTENPEAEKAEEVIGLSGDDRAAAAVPALIRAAVEEQEEEKPKRSVGQIVLIIIAAILAIEIIILGIRYFAPESSAAKAIGNAQTEIFQTVSGWFEGINDMFSGNDSNQDQDANNGEDTDQDKTGQEKPGAEQPDGGTNVPAPDPNPIADKNALVSSQLGNNINIEQVKANEALAYKPGTNYGQPDINNSKPITNNIWLTPETGEPTYYDKSVVGAIIAFDSQWIDYVNNGNKGVIDLLKKDSEAYRKAVSFSKVGKIKETFKLLEIGEIRQGADGFYVWAHEEIQITEKGKTTNQKYNWIYYLEPIDGKMQIVNYFKFQ